MNWNGRSVLAADHGGRGYVELHQSACALNMMLDQLVFDAAVKAKADEKTILVYGRADAVAGGQGR